MGNVEGASATEGVRVGPAGGDLRGAEPGERGREDGGEGPGMEHGRYRNVVLKLSIDLSLEPGPIWDDILARELRFPRSFRKFPCPVRVSRQRPSTLLQPREHQSGL